MHESRLTVLLRELLQSRRVAALGTIGKSGEPFVSMVPFAIEPTGGYLVLHVSGLAAHTGNMLDHPHVSVLVMQSEIPGEPVHALPRVTLEGRASVIEPHRKTIKHVARPI
jgi:putative heme iron utilization protein